MTTTSLSYCGNQARRFEKERFLCALFAPAPQREGLFSLLAFNYEIARIQQMVTEPMAGLIRLQWWREAVGAIYTGNAPHHEVAKPLATLVGSHRLSHAYFDTFLDAREEDMDEAPPADMEALLRYCGNTTAPLFSLMLEALNIRDTLHHEAVKPLGVAWGLTGIMRAMKFPAAKRLMFPVGLLHEHHISVEEVRAGKNLERTKPIVKTWVDIATAQLNAVKEVALQKQARPVFLIQTYIETYLKRIAKAEYDLFHTDLEGRHVTTQLRLLLRGCGIHA